MGLDIRKAGGPYEWRRKEQKREGPLALPRPVTGVKRLSVPPLPSNHILALLPYFSEFLSSVAVPLSSLVSASGQSTIT